jgi:glucose-1-phosphate thymidylyltransferase
MTCVVLAAGYATRLYPLTENFPKALLDVKGRPILSWLIDDILSTGMVDEYIVVSNGRYADHFRAWAANTPCPVTVLDNGTLTNETRLGAVRDLWFAVERMDRPDDILAIAGDNLLNFSLAGFIGYAREKRTSCVMRYKEEDIGKLRKGGVISVDTDDRITDMHEKPEQPASHWLAPPFYILTQTDARRLPQAVADGCGTDAPGSYIAWLCRRASVHAMLMPGNRYDIGDLHSYERVKSTWRTL